MGVLDIAPLHPRELARIRNTEVIFDDDFNDGLQGWSGLRNTGINFFPTLHPMCASGKQSMCLDVSDGVANMAATASKRASIHRKKMRWASRVGWTSDSASGANGMTHLRWSNDMDIGDMDEPNSRYWMDIRYTNYDESLSSGQYVHGRSVAIAPKWEANIGPAGAGFVWQTIDLDYELGYNQKNKIDWADVEIVYDLRDGVMEYVSLTVNGQTADLSGIPITPGPKIAEPATYFSNGANYLFWVENRTNNTLNATMFVDRTRCEVLP